MSARRTAHLANRDRAHLVNLVADQQLHDVAAPSGAIHFYFLQPQVQVFERVASGDIVHCARVGVAGQHSRRTAEHGQGRTEHDALRSPVVRAGQRPETLLTGRVPNRHLDLLAVHLHHLDLEIHTWPTHAPCEHQRQCSGTSAPPTQ